MPYHFNFLKKRTLKRGFLKCEEPGLELDWRFFQNFKILEPEPEGSFNFLLKQLEPRPKRFS
jgi:hypothetical protein